MRYKLLPIAIVLLLFLIPSFILAFSIVNVGAATSDGVVPGTVCSSPACKEMDDVWQEIAPLVGAEAGKVWDTTGSKWKDYTEVYSPPQVQQQTEISSGGWEILKPAFTWPHRQRWQLRQ